MTDTPVALVTGGAVRVGRAISRGLAAGGYRIAVNYKDSGEAGERLVEELGSDGYQAVAVGCDVTDVDAVAAMVDAVVGRYGRLDLVVNNAAVFERRTFLEVDAEMWRRTLDVNLSGVFHVGQAAGRVLWEAGRGRIVNICGVAGIEPLGDYAPYCAAKAGVDMLTRCMAEALAPRVQVNGVAPGTVLFPEETPEEEKAAVVDRIPGGAIGEPADVVAAVRFFASAPSFVTGAILTVDGGASLVGG